MLRKAHLMLMPALLGLAACGGTSQQESAATLRARQQALATSQQANQISQQAMATANDATAAMSRAPQPRRR
jgi:uncharacterized lipoprotein YmbA